MFIIFKIREIQIKLILRFHLTSMRIPEVNKATKIGEPSFTVGGIAEWWKSVWKTYREL